MDDKERDYLKLTMGYIGHDPDTIGYLTDKKKEKIHSSRAMLEVQTQHFDVIMSVLLEEEEPDIKGIEFLGELNRVSKYSISVLTRILGEG